MLSNVTLVTVLSFAALSVSRAYVQTTGVVTADAAKVRKEPSTESDMMAGLLKGSSVLIIDEVKDSAGVLWYKVSYENSTGYIRSDLLLKATAATTTNNVDAATTSTNATTSASKPAQTQVTAIAETKAYVNYESVRVRQGASAQHEIVGSAVKNTPVVLTGEAKAPDGKKWYQVKYTNSSGREVVGFIRSDLVTAGEPPAPVAAEPPAPAEQVEGNDAGEGESSEGVDENAEDEENTGENGDGNGQQMMEAPVPEETVKPDYEMAYKANNEGVEEWFLLDNIENTQQSLANLRAAAEAGEKLSQASSKQASTQKIIIIVLAVLVAVLAVAVTLLLFKIKDMYDEDYDDDDDDDDDDDEDDDDEEEERTIRRRRPVVNMAEKPQRPAAPVKTAARPIRESERKSVPVKKVEYDPEEEEFEAGQPVVQKPQPKRKAKNFLIEDDEFEFEFLNMDDKK